MTHRLRIVKGVGARPQFVKAAAVSRILRQRHDEALVHTGHHYDSRVLTDRLSALLLCPSQTAVENLAREGITRGVVLVGDVMADALRLAVERADDSLLRSLDLRPGGYALATVHRAENTDDLRRLQGILTGLARVDSPVIAPVHPRTRRAIAALGWTPPSHVRLIEPVGYLGMVALMRGARLILTDSGGVQKEAYWLGVPCVTLRDETEWVETVAYGWNTLVGADPERIAAAARQPPPTAPRPPPYGDGHAAERCVAALEGRI